MQNEIPPAVGLAIIRSMMAEEAISSTEIENGPMEPTERRITKLMMTFPTLSREECEMICKEDEDAE